MALQIQGNGGTVLEVGGSTFKAGHVHIKPVEHGALGHYRTTHRCLLASVSVANARLFEMRNSGSNLIIPTHLAIRLFQVAAGTVQFAGLDAYKVTSFTAVDTTNTVTPSVSIKRAGMAAAPGGAAIRGVTAAGAAAGMTLGTLTKDATPFYQLTYPVVAAAATSNAGLFSPQDMVDDVNGTHPFVFAQNEGFTIENRTLNVTSFGFELIVDFSWAEVTSF
jgi:hypothetical protein